LDSNNVRQVRSDGVMGSGGAFSQPLTSDHFEGSNDEPVSLKVIGDLNVIVWDEDQKTRKVVPMRWGIPHPKDWRVPQPIHVRSETMDELKTFKEPFGI
jgi:putative SOS response-associated peptidase YedK